MENFDLRKIEDLLKHFYNLTNIKICIYDSDENEICYYPEKLSKFCSLLRTNPAMDQLCQKCDKYAFSQCKKTREHFFYSCHAGLQECVSPILVNQKIIGYIAIGQIKTDQQPSFFHLEESFSKSIQRKLKSYFEQLPTIEINKIFSAIKILDACTGYEYLKKLECFTENKINVKLDEYINNHLTDNLSAPILCSYFHLSHNELYSIFKRYFQTTPAEYVKLRRLNAAMRLLKDTSLPINKIAQQCGIPDYNYFSKIFKATFKVSPREFRKSQM